MAKQNIGATLTLKDGGFFANMKSAMAQSGKLKDSLNGTSKAALSFGDRMKGVASHVSSVAKSLSVVGAAASAAVGAIVTKSVTSFAEYEQLTGGVETLFKGSADVVKSYANEAYKNAGIGANEYMNTVTSFSAALISSMGNDTNAAAARANMAINDMSDNANKMGTDMSSIIATYQSISRGNYAMLDNLKLGYGGTKKEMERLISDAERMRAEMGKPVKYNIDSFADVVSAIHDIQDSMDITGTTSTEAATTISGSLNMLKAAWDDTLTAITVGGDMLDGSVDKLVTSAATFVSNIITNIKKALGGVGDFVQKIAPVIAAQLPSLVSTVLPSLVSAAYSLAAGVAGQIPAIAKAVLSAVPAVLDGFGLTDTVSKVISVLDTLSPVILGVAGAFAAYKTAVLAASAATAVISGLKTAGAAFGAVMSFITSPIGLVVVAIGAVIAIGVALYKHWDEVKAWAINLWNGIKNVFEGIKNTIANAWNGISTFCIERVSAIKNNVVNTFFAMRDSVIGIFSSIKNAVASVWNGIKGLIKTPHIVQTGTLTIAGINTPIPKLGVQWYAKGGIMTKPTVFGYNGSNAMVGGESGAEAILPLDMLWSKLSQLMQLQRSEQTNNTTNHIYVTVNAGSVEDAELANKVAKEIVAALNNM